MTTTTLDFVAPRGSLSRARHPWRRSELRAIEANLAAAALLWMVLVLGTHVTAQGPMRSLLFACGIATACACVASERARRLAPTLVSRLSSNLVLGVAASQAVLVALALALS